MVSGLLNPDWATDFRKIRSTEPNVGSAECSNNQPPTQTQETMNQKIEKKPIRHEFTTAELLDLGAQLATSTSIKSQYKSRLDTLEAKADLLGNKMQAGFEMRDMNVFAVFRAKDGLKDYYAEGVDPKAKDAVVLLTEVMDPSDYQVELIQNKAQFENVVEIDLWPIAEESYGKLCLGRQREETKEWAETVGGGTYESLPDGSFSEQGTNVRTALVVIDR